MRQYARHACKSARVILAGDVFGARGGDKSRAGDGERPSRALRTQEVAKVVQGSTAGAAVASDGDGSTLLKSHGVREGDEAAWASVAYCACS